METGKSMLHVLKVWNLFEFRLTKNKRNKLHNTDMQTVKNILERKGSAIFSINGENTVFEALLEMSNKNVSALVVLKENELEGIFTERDYARKIALKGKASKDTLIKEVMSTEIQTISPDFGIEECMEIMTNQKIRHLPVLDEGKLAGMISIGDAVKSIIETQKETIKHLENYINS